MFCVSWTRLLIWLIDMPVLIFFWLVNISTWSFPCTSKAAKMASDSTAKVRLMNRHEISGVVYNRIYSLTFLRSINCVVKKEFKARITQTTAEISVVFKLSIRTEVIAAWIWDSLTPSADFTENSPNLDYIETLTTTVLSRTSCQKWYSIYLVNWNYLKTGNDALEPYFRRESISERNHIW